MINSVVSHQHIDVSAELTWSWWQWLQSQQCDVVELSQIRIQAFAQHLDQIITRFNVNTGITQFAIFTLHWSIYFVVFFFLPFILNNTCFSHSKKNRRLLNCFRCKTSENSIFSLQIKSSSLLNLQTNVALRMGLIQSSDMMREMSDCSIHLRQLSLTYTVHVCNALAQETWIQYCYNGNKVCCCPLLPRDFNIECL